ncbi:HDIG domain-containing protein [Desulfovibrio sp. OttesenSCG-928-G15]|nr:HDIG domain-containing protein [Desulfovibrio sp. OttesenSCG-928-G15]
MTCKKIPDKATSEFSLFWRKVNRFLPPKAYFLLLLVMALLAALASADFSMRQPLLFEGEIAPIDVVADKTVLFRDKKATALRQDYARKMQPLILDLDVTPADRLRERMQDILLSINNATAPEQKEALRKKLAEEFKEKITPDTVSALASPVVQNAILGNILPMAEQRLRDGLLSEISSTHAYPGGVLVRNRLLDTEELQLDAFNIPDLTGLELQLGRAMSDMNLPLASKKAISLLMRGLIRPTLIPNFDDTLSSAEQLAKAVEPVMHKVQKGEILIQQGDRVSREQRIKMQVLLDRNAEPFQAKKCLGIFLCSLLVSLGLIFSPSGKAPTSMTNKDFIFLAVLLALFSLMSKGLAAHGAQIASVTVTFLPESLAYAVPVAGAAAISSQIFSARRYLVTGLLLSLFCTLLMGGGLPLFLFYFLTAMWSTWLTNRTTSRREMVISLLPLVLGMLAMWAGATLVQDGVHNRYFSEIIAVVTGAFLSMVLTFAVSPIVEMVFGYTTRFRLMELLNLEQPILRDLMLNAPGTYHHSLIVSNMCEAGAKRVGAHSLLCKVAALYHDIGKISKANYFIENQPTDDNPHNRLTPSMSALILISHVKQGTELAKQHRLGQEVTDIICQHHGNSIIQYFYRKALNQTDAPPPNIEDFRYPGPRPRSKEAALVMLADIVEASSRTLTDPTPTRLRQHIDNIMKGVYSAGQLDESELTFKDLDILADSFQQMLRGLFHHRITYPGPGTGKAQPMTPGQGASAGQATNQTSSPAGPQSAASQTGLKTSGPATVSPSSVRQ